MHEYHKVYIINDLIPLIKNIVYCIKTSSTYTLDTLYQYIIIYLCMKNHFGNDEYNRVEYNIMVQL